MRLAFFAVLVSCSLCVFAQSEVCGVVVDSSDGSAVVGAVVSSGDSHVITDADGRFCLAVHDDVVVVRCLGYEAQRVSSPVSGLRVALAPAPVAIAEVQATASAIVQHADTITYATAAFAEQGDRTLADVVDRMPGLSVAHDGRATFNGHPVDNVYIEGVDLWDGRYGMALRNLNFVDMAAVDVLECHQPVKLLQDDAHSRRETALNIRLKEGARHRPSGHLKAEGGVRRVWATDASCTRVSDAVQGMLAAMAGNTHEGWDDDSEVLTPERLREMATINPPEAMMDVAPATPQFVREEQCADGRVSRASLSTAWRTRRGHEARLQGTFAHHVKDAEWQCSTSYFLPDGVEDVVEADAVRLVSQRGNLSFGLKRNQDSAYVAESLRATVVRDVASQDVESALPSATDAEAVNVRLENHLALMRKTSRGRRAVLWRCMASFVPEDMHISMAGQDSVGQHVGQWFAMSSLASQWRRARGRWQLGADVGIDHDWRRTSCDLSGVRSCSSHLFRQGARLSPFVGCRLGRWGLKLSLPTSASVCSGADGSQGFLSVSADFEAEYNRKRWHWVSNLVCGTEPPLVSAYYDAPIFLSHRSRLQGSTSLAQSRLVSLLSNVRYNDARRSLFANATAMVSVSGGGLALARSVDSGLLTSFYVPSPGPQSVCFGSLGVSKGLLLFGRHALLSATVSGHRSWASSLQNGVKARFVSSNLSPVGRFRLSPYDWFAVESSCRLSADWGQGLGARCRGLASDGSLAVHLSPGSRLSVVSSFHRLACRASDVSFSLGSLDAKVSFQVNKWLDFTMMGYNLLDARQLVEMRIADLQSDLVSRRLRGRELTFGARLAF